MNRLVLSALGVLCGSGLGYTAGRMHGTHAVLGSAAELGEHPIFLRHEDVSRGVPGIAVGQSVVLAGVLLKIDRTRTSGASLFTLATEQAGAYAGADAARMPMAIVELHPLSPEVATLLDGHYVHASGRIARIASRKVVIDTVRLDPASRSEGAESIRFLRRLVLDALDGE